MTVEKWSIVRINVCLVVKKAKFSLVIVLLLVKACFANLFFSDKAIASFSPTIARTYFFVVAKSVRANFTIDLLFSRQPGASVSQPSKENPYNIQK